MAFLIALALLQAAPHAMPGEEAVAPYTPGAANMGAPPFDGDAMAKAFHGREGISRIVDRMVADAYADPVIGDIFKGHDRIRLHRTLVEQFCAILNAGCTYSGRDMASSHKDLGVQRADMNRLVELLQKAMTAEGVGFQAQNRFLSKLAPMHRDVVGK
jgi:hemoglobin